VWSRNKANLYIQDALVDFEPDLKNRLCSPPAQYRMYRDKLMLTHLVGFGGAAGGIAGTSYLLDGDSDYLSVPDGSSWAFAGGDFTIDMWIYPNTAGLGYHQGLLSQFQGDNDRWALGIVAPDNYLGYWHRDADSWTVEAFAAAGAVTADAWNHVSAERYGDEWDVYLDGTSVKNVTDSSSLGDLAAVLAVGVMHAGGSSPYYLNGQIEEIHISKGIARHQGNFAPPVTPASSDANSVLLIHCNETIASGTTGSGATFTDSGNVGHTVTEVGTSIRTLINAKVAD
jgi:hypothetical protein